MENRQMHYYPFYLMKLKITKDDLGWLMAVVFGMFIILGYFFPRYFEHRAEEAQSVTALAEIDLQMQSNSHAVGVYRTRSYLLGYVQGSIYWGRGYDQIHQQKSWEHLYTHGRTFGLSPRELTNIWKDLLPIRYRE